MIYTPGKIKMDELIKVKILSNSNQFKMISELGADLPWEYIDSRYPRHGNYWCRLSNDIRLEVSIEGECFMYLRDDKGIYFDSNISFREAKVLVKEEFRLKNFK